MRIYPRALAKVLAHLGGYFWLPCPICKEPYAGFEAGIDALMGPYGIGKCVCSKPGCKAEARRRNQISGCGNSQVYVRNTAAPLPDWCAEP